MKQKQTKKDTPMITDMLHYNLELEEVILGALMIEKTALPTVRRFIRKEMFYDEKHQNIFQAIDELYKEDLNIDILTVTERVKQMGKLEEVGGPYFITALSGKVASSAHLEFHCRIVMDLYLRRMTILCLQKRVIEACDPTIEYEDVLMNVQRDAISLLDESPLLSNMKEMPELVDIIMKEVKERGERSGQGITGIPTGLADLNRMTMGWQNGDLIILGARPSEGKTALALKFALEAARAGKNAVIFILEMKGERLTDRLMLGESGVNPLHWKLGRLNEEETRLTHEAAGRIAQLPIRIDDTPNASIDEICYMAKTLRAKNELDLLIVDYIGLCRPGVVGRTREQEVAECSARFKALARQLDCPVILLSQLNRELEGRAFHKPKLSDLRDSGAIEQDADVVLLLSRPARQGVVVDKESGYPTEGLGILSLAKQRNGEIGTVYFGHDKAMVRIGDYMPPESYVELMRRESLKKK